MSEPHGAASDRPVLRTERLVLEPMTREHLPFLRELDGDPEVMRFILGRARTGAEVDAFWGRLIDEQIPGPLGMWVGSVDGAPVGWWSLWPTLEAGVAEAGWRLRRAAWGRGLASEGARRIVDHGFRDAGLDRIVADTTAVNAGSRRVMAAIGMREVRTEVRRWEHPLPGAELGEVVAELRRADWAAAAGRTDP